MSEVIAIISGGVAVIAVIIAIGQYRQASPKRRISLHVLGTPLVNMSRQIQEPVIVEYSGHVLSDPQIVTVTIEATGRADVPSDRFDGSKPIGLTCGAGIVALLGDAERLASKNVRVSDDGTRLLFGPTLLQRARPIEVSVLTDGRGDLVWDDSALIDTTVVVSAGPRRSGALPVLTSGAVAGIAAAVTAIALLAQ